MLIINNTVIKSKQKCTIFIKDNDIVNVSDPECIIEKYYRIGYKIEDKIYFLNIFRKYLKNRSSFIIFINSNDINKSFNLERLNSFINYVEENKMDRVSDKYLILRYGYLNTKDREIRKLTLENYIKKYGKNLGSEKYFQIQNTHKKSSKRSIEYWKNIASDTKIANEMLKEYQSSHIKKYLKNKSKEWIKRYNLENSPWNLEYYLKRNFTKLEALKKISDIKKESSKFCKEYYLKKGFSEEESEKLKSEYWFKKCRNCSYKTSKKSLKQFSNIIDLLNQIKGICIYYGDNENGYNEYFLYDNIDRKYYFYDLSILFEEKKLIVEYNGNKFHPNKEKLSNDEWLEWKSLFNEMTAEEKYNYDVKKEKIARQNGFEYLIIWDNDSLEVNNKKILDFVTKYIQF